MFNDKISVFRTFNSAPFSIPLKRWIEFTMNPKTSLAKQVKLYRKTEQKEFKKRLPLATVGAVCKGGRKMENVATRTGWIALDIDGTDNPHISNVTELRNKMGLIVYVAFAGLSASGKGVWALAKVRHPQKQAKYFKQLQQDFKSRGIILDSSKGKNPNDARFYSLDPNAYIANEFKIYDRLPNEKSTAYKMQLGSPLCTNSETRKKVEQLIEMINTDITAGYQNWYRLGFALESEFGENGRKYFHAISRFHSDYSPRECDWQYTECLEHNGSGISIGTFFYWCKLHGYVTGKA